MEEEKQKKKNNRLSYRFPQAILEDFKKACDQNCLDGNKVIEKTMQNIIEKYKDKPRE